MSASLNVICEYTSKHHRQGDNVLLLFRVVYRDSSIIENLNEYNIDLYLRGEKSIFKRFSYKDGEWNSHDVEMDSAGYVAVHLSPMETSKMQGSYCVQVLLSDSNGTIQSPAIFAVEIIPSAINKILIQ